MKLFFIILIYFLLGIPSLQAQTSAVTGNCENAISLNFNMNPATCVGTQGGAYFNASSINGAVTYEYWTYIGDSGSGSLTGTEFISISEVGDCVVVTFTDEMGCQIVESGCVSVDNYAMVWVDDYSEIICSEDSNGFICIETDFGEGPGGNLLAEFETQNGQVPSIGYCAQDLSCGSYYVNVESEYCDSGVWVEIDCDDNCCTLEGCMDSSACNYDSNVDCEDGSCIYEPCGTCPGDSDLNGNVDVLDLLSISANFGCTTGCYGNGDANFDGAVNVLDLLATSSSFSNACAD